MTERAHGDPRCGAREQATAELPCWGKIRVYDTITCLDDEWEFEACEGHYAGMRVAGAPCDLSKYRAQ